MAELSPDNVERSGSLKVRQRQERAALILQAAEAVLIEKGYHETSMEEIANRVGIAKGTVYLHYPSKDSLVVALFAQEMQAFLHTVEQLVATKGASSTQLEAIVNHVYTDSNKQRRQLFASLYRDMTIRNGIFEKQLAIHEYLASLGAVITRVLEAGKAAGEFDSRIPTAVMLGTFLSLLSSHTYDEMLAMKSLSFGEIAHYISRIYLRGIAPES